ncbi:MAG: hypothetical protein JWM68_3933, partial [Verrucomicrobiales bacterium]|nr:hypothetical protein [Verrucomicrobiales bacterium]
RGKVDPETRDPIFRRPEGSPETQSTLPRTAGGSPESTSRLPRGGKSDPDTTFRQLFRPKMASIPPPQISFRAARFGEDVFRKIGATEALP